MIEPNNIQQTFVSFLKLISLWGGQCDYSPGAQK